MTVLEILIAMVIMGIIIFPLVRYMAASLKGILHMQSRTAGQDITRIAIVDIERDLKDLNELFQANATSFVGVMDSHRMPGYDPNADFDGDGIPNGIDVDDDNDAMYSTATLANWTNLYVSKPAVALNPRRTGFDLDDDDDNNSIAYPTAPAGDVRINYRYNGPSNVILPNTLCRRFSYDGADWVPEYEVVAKNVKEVKFEYFGYANAPGIPQGADLNGDGFLDLAEFELMDTGSADNQILDTFIEKRHISIIRYTISIQPNPKRQEVITTTSEVLPLLMPIKRKG